MRGNRFNFIEIIPSYPDKIPSYLSVLWKGKNFKDFTSDGRGSLSDKFRDFILKKRKISPKSLIVFYIANLEFLFPSVLCLRDAEEREEDALKDVNFLIIGNRIYFIRIKVGGDWVLFKNLGLLLNIDLSENQELNDKSYIPLGFSNKPLENGTEVLDYLLNPKDEVRLDFMLKEGEVVKSFVTKILFYGIDWKDRDEAKICLSLRNNLSFLSEKTSFLDENLKKLWKNWYFNYSIPSVSKEMFYRFFNKFNINLELEIDLDRVIRPAYIGGRCEIFGNPTSDEITYHFDFNNMYGLAMKENFPMGKPTYIKDPKKIEKIGFYYILAESSKMYIPILPVKENVDAFGCLSLKREEDQEDNELFFPNGTISGLFYSEEIELFLKEGGSIKKIEYAWIYEETARPLFKGFAEEMIKLRKEDKNGLWKQLIVSFYGRLGMLPRDSTSILGDALSYKKTILGLEIKKEAWFGKYFIAEIKKELPKVVPSRVDYAAMITSKARIKLWKKLKEVIDKGGRLVYCDTDSVFFCLNKENSGVLDKIDCSEGKIVKLMDAVFALQRTYSVKLNENEWETKVAGIQRNSISFENFKKIFYNERYWGFAAPKTIKSIYNTEKWLIRTGIGVKNYNKRFFNLNKKKTTPPFRTLCDRVGDKLISRDPFFS